MTPFERIVSKLQGVTGSGKSISARCPAHDDQRASLSVTEAEDGRVLAHCHAGCSFEDICEKARISVRDLMPDSNGRRDPQRIAATYNYCDEAGKLEFQVVRYEPKGFRQRRPIAGGGYEWSVKGTRALIYLLPVILANREAPVFVVEGEKDAETLKALGLLATCNAGGAGKWKISHAKFLTGRKVIILPDNDDAGRKHAQNVAYTLQGVAASVQILELPGLPPKGDVTDWIAGGGTKEELQRLVDSAAGDAAHREWPELRRLDDAELPGFPVEALPKDLGVFVAALSQFTQTPPELAGLLVLSVCAAAIARRVVIQARDGWIEPVNLFVAILLGPANRKSAVFSEALKPLRELEAELIEAERPTVAKLQSERRQREARLKKLEKIAAEKNDLEARHEAQELAAALAEEPETVLPRLIVDDATSEKLGMILADQGGRIASMSPEGSVFDLMAGMYSKNGSTQFGVYLQGHSGDDLVTDRVSRPTVRVSQPALTCAYTIQPQVIEGLAENPAFRGRGLLARFLYAAPESWIGNRQIAPPPVPEGLHEVYRRVVRRLFEIAEGQVLQLTPEAANAFMLWEAEIEQELGDGGVMEMIRDWGGKLAGATLRISAIMHCVDHDPNGPVEAPTIEAAIKIARFLIPHAEAVLGMMQAQDRAVNSDALYVVKWIRRHDRREFTKSEAQHHGKRRFPLADDIEPALGELVSRGYIRHRPASASGPGRPSSPTYEVNPAIFEPKSNGRHSHNSQYLLPTSAEPYSGNIGSASAGFGAEKRVEVTI